MEAVLDQLLELDEADRSSEAQRLCAGQPELLREVQALVQAADASTSFLARPVSESMPELVRELENEPQKEAGQGAQASSLEGQQLGPYLVERRLGQGSMGEVYLGRRTDGSFQREVAIKVIHHGRDQGRFLERFQQEREILAALDHPHIAALLDAGVSEDDRYYAVMEYVQGLPLDQHCRQAGLDLEGKLELFLDVCDAVHHAHRRLVIHRDLKPSNILVDHQGRVKLLDFGIAKLMAEDGQSTQGGTLLLTPDYAAPEQFLGAPLSTATDVYALGALLFELLTGQRLRSLEATSGAETLQQVVSREPPLMSSRAQAQDPGLARRLRGDLDSVVAKALRPAAEQRYAGADSLADDLRRHLSSQPVQAREGKLSYRAGRFLRRNALAVAAALLVLLAVAGGTFAVWRGSELAREQREQALLQAQRAERVTGFLVGLFDGWDPYEFESNEVSARQLLDLGAERARGELVSEPRVQAELLTTLGQVYERVGLLAESESLLQEVRPLVSNLPAEDALLAASALNHLGQVRHERGDPADAIPILDEALSLLPALSPGPGPGEEQEGAEIARMRSTILLNRGHSQRGEGDYEAAVDDYQEGLALARQVGWRAQEAGCLASLAVSIHGGQRMDEELLQQSVDIYRELEAQDHEQAEPESLRSALNNLAIHFLDDGRWKEAGDAFEELIELDSEILGPEHPNVGTRWINLGRLRIEQGRFEEALQLLDRATEILDVAGVGESGFTRMALSMNRGRAEAELGRGEAVATLDRARELFVRNAGADHPELASINTRIAESLLRLGQPRQALSLLQPVLEALAPDHVRRADAELVQGAALAALDRCAEALPWLSKGVEAWQQSQPAHSWRLAWARLELAECQMVQGQEFDVESRRQDWERLREARGAKDALVQRPWRLLGSA